MNWRKGLLAGAGTLLLILAIHIYFAPKGAYHTYYDRIFYDTLSIQSYDEKIVDLLLENQARYRFRLSAADGPSDVNLNVIITDSDGNELSLLDFRDQGETIYWESISNRSGNYSIYLKELNEGYSYTASFSVAQRIDDYYPEGGRYARAFRSSYPKISLSFEHKYYILYTSLLVFDCSRENIRISLSFLTLHTAKMDTITALFTAIFRLL